MIRCQTLDAFLNKIEDTDGVRDRLTVSLEASIISDKIIEFTAKSGFSKTDYDSIILNLEHFSLAVFSDNICWARESLNNVKELAREYF